MNGLSMLENLVKSRCSKISKISKIFCTGQTHIKTLSDKITESVKF